LPLTVINGKQPTFADDRELSRFFDILAEAHRLVGNRGIRTLVLQSEQGRADALASAVAKDQKLGDRIERPAANIHQPHIDPPSRRQT
jgi:hypothetical protein